MKPLIIASCLFSFSAFAQLDRPESVLFHKNQFYVSNMSGPGNLKDGQGWISTIDKNGKILKAKWVDGLNAPKGLGVYKGQLYTGDIDEIAVIDLAKKTVKKISVPGAKLLNDIVIDPSGNLYISDTFGSKIFKVNLETQEVKELVTLKESPNGLLLVGETLLIAGYGKSKPDGSGLEDGPKGGLSSYDLKTGEVKMIIPELGKIDGIDMTKDGQILITVKVDEALYWVDVNEKKITGALKGKTAFAHLTDVADMGYDPKTNTIYLPNTNGHNIQVIRLR